MFFFTKGDEVVLAARPDAGSGVITDVITSGSEPQYEVLFVTSGQKRVYGARSLELAGGGEDDETDPLDFLRSGDLASAEDFRAFMTLAKLETPLANNLYSFAASRTERLPHQFKPVLKLLSSPYGRLLVADEVGLGKTIEAGIILTELTARGGLDNVLIVCPSPLTEKWRREMRERFLASFDVLDGRAFRQALKTSTSDPLAEPLRGITSLELLRREENLTLLGELAPQLDLVIVDEAHHMRNVGTATNELGDVLTSLADTCVFLTATPLNLGRADFFELMRLLVPEEFPELDTFVSVIEPNAHLNTALRRLRSGWPPPYEDALKELEEVERTEQARRFLNAPRYREVKHTLQRGADGERLERSEVVEAQRGLTDLNTLSHVFTRTRKREVQELFPTRRSKTVSATFTEAERRFYDAVTDWVLDEYADRAAHLVVVTFQRLAASCLPALGRRLVDASDSGVLRFTSDEVAELEDDALIQDEETETSDIEISESTRGSLDELVAAWSAYKGQTDSKYDAFATALAATFDEGAERVLVFSYFTGTIDYLAERLATLRPSGRPLEVVKLYGPMNSEQRAAAVDRFRASRGPVVLLSSEVGSEGLDFQFCSRMFNYDLPWNPMRVEQRIGRLDRYGQESDLIWIMNMIVADTVEERIFYRLYDRIKIFEESIGDLEAILGDIEFDLQKLQREALRGQLSPAEQERRSNLLADVILRRQKADEEFEEESKRFLSNDDVFLDIFNDIERGRRYVTPVELQRITERYLASVSPQLELVASADRPGAFDLVGPVADLRRSILRTLSIRSRNAHHVRTFLGRLGDGLRLTFDPRLATASRSLEFVSLRHPIIEALTSDEGFNRSLKPSGVIGLSPDLLQGERVFFVFELSAQGVKDELEFVAIAVGKDGQVDDVTSAALLGLFEDAKAVTGSETLVWGEDALRDAYETASSWVAAVRESKEQQLARNAEATLIAQRESLRLTADRKQLWLTEQIQNARSDSIRRMRSSQLARLSDEYVAKQAALEQPRGVAVGSRLVAAGIAVPTT